MHAPLRRRKRAVSILRVPPFWPETGKTTIPGGAPVATAVSSSNGTNPKFTYKRLSEVGRLKGCRVKGGTERY